MAINSALVREVVSNAALSSFADYLLPMSTFAIDFGGEIGAKGQTVNVPVYNSYTAGDFAGDYTTNASNDVGAVTVTVNKHKYKTISLTDLENANNGAGSTRWEMFGQKLGEALALSVFQDVLSLVTAANFGTAAITSASSAFDTDDVVDLKALCDADKMPKSGRGLVLADGHFNALLKDSGVKNAANYGSTDGIQQGMIPNLVGYKTWQSGAIPANSENLVGFGATESAIAMAMRYLVPQRGGDGYDAVAQLQDPVTGAVLGMREWVDPATGTAYMTLEANYGYSVGQEDALTRIVSS